VFFSSINLTVYYKNTHLKLTFYLQFFTRSMRIGQRKITASILLKLRSLDSSNPVRREGYTSGAWLRLDALRQDSYQSFCHLSRTTFATVPYAWTTPLPSQPTTPNSLPHPQHLKWILSISFVKSISLKAENELCKRNNQYSFSLIIWLHVLYV